MTRCTAALPRGRLGGDGQPGPGQRVVRPTGRPLAHGPTCSPRQPASAEGCRRSTTTRRGPGSPPAAQAHGHSGTTMRRSSSAAQRSLRARHVGALPCGQARRADTLLVAANLDLRETVSYGRRQVATCAFVEAAVQAASGGAGCPARSNARTHATAFFSTGMRPDPAPGRRIGIARLQCLRRPGTRTGRAALARAGHAQGRCRDGRAWSVLRRYAKKNGATAGPVVVQPQQ